MTYLIIASFLLSILMIGMLYEQISALKAIVLGAVDYFFIYVLCSGMLFWVNWYSINKAVVFSAMVLLAIIGILRFRKKRAPQFIFVKKEWEIFAAVVLVVLSLSSQKFGFFGMGQDQGVYQTKAIELLQGNNERVFEFEEYDGLETENQKEAYYQTVKKLAGYDLLDIRKPMIDEAQGTMGIFHGIPTFPALLALFGKMFGMAHMQDCQTVFMILFLMLAFYILENYHIKIWLQIPSLLLLCVSPQIIWTSKSALTEMFLAVIVVAFLLLLTEYDEKVHKYSWIPLLVFSFYHVTIYTVVPMFLLIYWGLYLITKDKAYLKTCNFALLGYVIGFFFMLYISPVYTSNNYEKPLEKLGFVNDDTLIPIVLIAVALAFFITNVMPFVAGRKGAQVAGSFAYEHRDKIYKGALGAILILFVIMGIRKGITIDSAGMVTLVAMVMATGTLLLPVALIRIFSMHKEQMVGKEFYVIHMLAIYSVFVYSLFLRFEIPYNYYYGRYIVPYLLIIVVLFCTLVNDVRKCWLAVIPFLGILGYIQPDYVLLTQQDDTRVSWECLEGVSEILETENSAVIVSGQWERTFFLPIKSMGCDVYNQWENIQDEIAFLDEKYENVYYLTGAEGVENEEDFSVLYKNMNKASEDFQSKLQYITRYPLEFLDESGVITLYKYNSNHLEYDIATDNFQKSGFGMLENKSFAWTNSENVEVECYFEPGDYLAELQLGTGIPMERLGISEYVIDVYVNEVYLTSITIDETNNGKALYFEVPEEIQDRKKVISFRSNLWSPMEYGENDSRKMGFAFESLKLYDESNPVYFYEIYAENFIGEGFCEVENETFAWTGNNKAEVICFLEPKDYEVTVTQGVALPLESIGVEKYAINIYANDNYVSTVYITGENNGGEIVFSIPAEKLTDGKNIIRFESELWSPSDWGSEDVRQLGFGLSTMEFECTE